MEGIVHPYHWDTFSHAAHPVIEGFRPALTWPNQTEVTVNGIHFIQDDSADEIAAAIKEWMG